MSEYKRTINISLIILAFPMTFISFVFGLLKFLGANPSYDIFIGYQGLFIIFWLTFVIFTTLIHRLRQLNKNE